MAKRTIKWEVADGYVGGSRPQTYTFDDSGFEGMTVEEIIETLGGEITDDFHSKVSWSAPDLDKIAAEIAAKKPDSD